MHILVVDDEPNMLRTLVDIFRDEGFDTSPRQREQAVEMRTLHAYDVVLMDVRMPGIDGIEAFHRIRLRRPHIPVVMMSAYGVDHLTQDGLRDGVVAFVQKPLDVAKVLWMMRSLASHTDPGDPSDD
jgi:CheY-like chemotaxis protein